MSLDKASKAIQEKVCADLDAPDPNDLIQDPAYEKRIEASYSPKENGSIDDHKFFDILKGSLKDSRDLRGYGPKVFRDRPKNGNPDATNELPERKHDLEVIENWKNKYNRSEKNYKLVNY